MEHLKNQINAVRSTILSRVEKGQLVPLEIVEPTIEVLNKALKWDLSAEEISHIAFQIQTTMNIGIDKQAIILGNSENNVKRWFDASKTSALALVCHSQFQTLLSRSKMHFLDQNLHLAHQRAGSYT